MNRFPGHGPARRSIAGTISAALVGALAVLVGQTALGAVVAQAIAGNGSNFDCTGNTIYTLQRGVANSSPSPTTGVNGSIYAVDTAAIGGASVTDSLVTTIPDGGFSNALGITTGGAKAYVVDQSTTSNATTTVVHGYDAATGTWSSYTGAAPGNANFVAGAIDPKNGFYYYATFVSGNAVIYGFNTATNTAIPGIVATTTLPEGTRAGGYNGDIAFDRAGNLYIVSSVGTAAATGIVRGPLPTTGDNATLTDTVLNTYSDPNSYGYNGISFDNYGHLYIQYSSSPNSYIFSINPNTGARIGADDTVQSPNSFLDVDLGACSVNPTLVLKKNVVNRVNSNDQFTLSITGSGVTLGNTATTTGTTTGIQSEQAGPVIGVYQDSYTLAESAGNAGTDLSKYTTTYSCTDAAANNRIVASGTGQTISIPSFPAPADGASAPFVVCTFTNSGPHLVVSKSVDPSSTTPVAEGQTLTYTQAFDNSAGARPAAVDFTDNLSEVLDDSTVTTAPALATGAGLTVSSISGGAFTVTGTLAAGAKATVTYAVRVNAPDSGNHQLDNFLVPTGTSPPLTCSASNTSCTTNPVPDLIVSKAVNPASTTAVVEGQALTYTLTFDNSRGKAPAFVDYTDNLSRVLDDATVTTAPAAGTSPGLTPDAIIGDAFRIHGEVAPGSTDTITYTVTINAPDTGDHAADNFLVPTGTTPPTTCLMSNPDCTTNPVPHLVVSKSVNPSSTTSVLEGQSLTYTLTFDNSAGKAPASVNYTDDASGVLDDATVTAAPALATGAGLTVGGIAGGAFTITGTLAAGSNATVTYTVKVNTPDTGNHSLDNYLVPTGTTPPRTCPTTESDCTTNPVPALVVSKSVNPASTTAVAEGQTLTYTLSFANSAGKASAPVDYTDVLAGVLDDASVTTAPVLASGAGLTVDAITGGSFRVTGSVAAGATATVSYQVTVNSPDAGDHSLDNFVVPTGTMPPATCGASNPDCTTNPVPDLVVTKAVTPASTTAVLEGQTLTYTLTFDNSNGKAPASVNYTDVVDGVLDDASVTTGPRTTSGLTVSGVIGGAFTVTGTLAAGSTATVTYSAKVNTPDTGNHSLDNFVVPTGTTPPVTCVLANAACTTNPVPALVVSKAVSPATTTTVLEGQTLTYTLSFDNSAGKAPAGVSYTDDASAVLDDAAVTTNPALTTGAGLTVGALAGGSFTITGTVAAGATATVTYSVKVSTPDTGNHRLDNFLVPTGTTPPNTCVPNSADCTTNPVPDLVVTKAVNPSSTTAVAEGQTLTYTLTFDNSGGKAPAAVYATDDLSAVLDDASVTGAPALASGVGLTVGTVTGGTFRITGSVAAGTTATVSYSVTVNSPDRGDHSLVNFVVPTGTTPPTTCLAADPTCTVNPVPNLVVTKVVNPSSTTPVHQGQTLTYTLTFDNTTGKAPATVNETDDLSRVLDDATIASAPAIARGSGLTIGDLANDRFAITGTIAAGASVTVLYRVAVKTPDAGDHSLDNFIVPTGTTPPTSCVSGNADCTTNPVPDLVITKTVDPASNTMVAEGQTLTYTLHFDNSHGRATAVVDAHDDLSDVLDDAVVTSAPHQTQGSALVVGAIVNNEFFVTGSVAAGQIALVTYSVRVDSPDNGDGVLQNHVLTGSGPPPNCSADPTRCTTNRVHTPALPPLASTGLHYSLWTMLDAAGLLLLLGLALHLGSGRGRRYTGRHRAPVLPVSAPARRVRSANSARRRSVGSLHPRATIALLALALLGCTSAGSSSHHETAPADSSSTVSSGAPVVPSGAGSLAAQSAPKGAALLRLGASSQLLALQLCQKTATGGLSVTAAGSGKPPSTLVLDLLEPVSASTMVFTTRKADNSFTTHSMGSAATTTGAVQGTRVLVDGTAKMQAYSASGKARGSAKSEPIGLTATCRAVVKPNPPPSYGTMSATKSSSPSPTKHH